MSDEPTAQEQLDALPAEHREKVEKVYQALSGVLRQKLADKLQHALQIGGYIYDEFYNGELRMYQERGNGTPSLEGLHARIALELGAQALSLRTLHYYVTTAIQDRKWGDLIRKGKMDSCVTAVGYTHRIHLDGCVNLLDEIRIAEETAREGLSVSQVEERVDAANSREGGGGRPDRLSQQQRALFRFKHAVDALLDFPWQGLSDDELCWMHDIVTEQTSRLQTYSSEGEGERRRRFDGRLDPVSQNEAPPFPGLEELLDSVLGEEDPGGSDGAGPGVAPPEPPLVEMERHARHARGYLEHADDPGQVLRALHQWVPVVGLGLRRLHRVPRLDRFCNDILVRHFREMLDDVRGLRFLEPAMNEMGKRITTLPGTGPIFVVLSHEPWEPEVGIPDLPSQLKPHAACFLRAPDKEVACQTYREATNDLRSLFALPIGVWIKAEDINADGRSYPSKVRRNRLPTLEELIEERKSDPA